MLIKWLCYLYFKLTGWEYVEYNIPKDLRSFVMLGAPHTSNWDFIPAMSVALMTKRNAHFVIKSEWLKFPLNLIFKPLGAIGVDRKSIQSGKVKSSTDAMADLFKTNKDFVLMIAPEGTRSANDQWKTGFYYIAQKAGVPLVLGFDDWKEKKAGLGKVIYPTNFEKDMQDIMDFYKNIHAKVPEKFKLDKNHYRP
jgi:1-acyl-sn-glycerol-3-phosphate acyltransferase